MSLRKLFCFLFTAFFLCSKGCLISDVLASHDDFTDLEDIELDNKPIKTAKTQQPKKTVLKTLDDLYKDGEVPVVVAVTYSGDKCKAKMFGHASVIFRIDADPKIRESHTYFRVDLRLKATEIAEELLKRIENLKMDLSTKTAFGEDTTEIESKIAAEEHKLKDEEKKSGKDNQLRVHRLCFSRSHLQQPRLAGLKASIESYEVIYKSSFKFTEYKQVQQRFGFLFRKLDYLDKDPSIPKELGDELSKFNVCGGFSKNCLEFAEVILAPIPNPFITISFSKIPYFEQLLVENPKEGFFDIKYYCYRTGDCLASVNRLC
jgi:hypothetical protein